MAVSASSGRPAERLESLTDLGAPAAGAVPGLFGKAADVDGADLVGEVEDDALGALLADAGDAREGRGVAGGDGVAEGLGAEHFDGVAGDARADALGALEQFEQVAFLGGVEAVQGDRVLADDRGDREDGLRSRP